VIEAAVVNARVRRIDENQVIFIQSLGGLVGIHESGATYTESVLLADQS
jgi:hypothetical protein